MACASGALIAECIALTALQMQTSWLLAGGMGAAIWNYWSSSRAAWGVPPQHHDAAAGVVVVQPGRT